MLWWYLAPANLVYQIAIVSLALFAGVWSAGRMERQAAQRDPSEIVIDEVAGMWCALLGAPQSLWIFLAAFAGFRFLDIVKPGPIRRLEQLPGGWGVMLDDLAAGLLTLAGVLAVRAVA